MSVSHAISNPRTINIVGLFQRRRHLITVSIALVIYGIVSWLILAGATDQLPRFSFDPSHIMSAGGALQLHVVSALLTLGLGIGIMTRIPKGSRQHKVWGWTWVGAMSATAITSFFLTGLNGGSFSWIHGLSAWTMLVLPFGIGSVRRKNVKSHAKEMTGLFVNGMLIAGLFSFLPGRLLWHTFFAI